MPGHRPRKTGIVTFSPAHPQVAPGRTSSRRNTLRIFRGRERSRCRHIVRHSRKVNVGQAPRDAQFAYSILAGCGKTLVTPANAGVQKRPPHYS
jgi:hypothetical protein